MNKRLISLLLILFTSLSILFAENISFSGGKSKLVMREGEKSVTLSEGANVISGSLSIVSDEMSLTGDNWRTISAKGNIAITDQERGLEIKTGAMWYDREDELVVISNWFELDDKEEELYAQAGSLRYDMKNEILEMGIKVELLKISDGEIMNCTAESVYFDKNANTLSLRGGAKVEWKGDVYEAEVVNVNTKDNTISLSGRIKGTING